jgi:hypothetical protein
MASNHKNKKEAEKVAELSVNERALLRAGKRVSLGGSDTKKASWLFFIFV